MAEIDATWPQAQPAAGPGAPDWGEPAGGDLADGASADFGRLGLILCFLAAVLTLAGVGSALERIVS